LSAIKVDLFCKRQIFEELYLNILIPGVFRVPVEVIVIAFRLKECIFDKTTARLKDESTG